MGYWLRSAVRVASVLMALLLVGACGDQDAPPLEAFVVSNETDRSLWVVSGSAGEDVAITATRASAYSPEIDPGDSFRRTYGVSTNGEPGGCWRNQQFYAVHLPAGTMDGVRAADIIDPRGIEVVKIWPARTCFDVDDQVEVVR